MKDLRKRRNGYFRIIAIAVLIPYLHGIFPLIPSTIAGFNLTGWSWMTIFFVSLYVILTDSKPSLNIYFWIPWIVYILAYIIIDYSFLGLQLTLQYLVWILVGLAASSFTYSKIFLKKITKWFFYYILIVVSYILYYKFKYRDVEDFSFGAASVMSVTVAGVLSLALFFQFRKVKFLFLYLAASLLPLLQVTRMGIAMMLIIFPLHFGKISFFKRIIFAVSVLFIGSTYFYLPAVQKKMFITGEGKVTDLIQVDNPNINTSGRNTWKELMETGIKENPMFGNGPRSDLELFQNEGYQIREAHNDYLAVRYNYGWIGLILLLGGFVFQFLQLLRIRKRLRTPESKVIISSALTLFLPLLGYMYSDNILKYSYNFGCFHFILIGVAFSLVYKNKNEYISNNSPIQQSVSNKKSYNISYQSDNTSN